MKKFLVSVGLGTVFAAGFLFAADHQSTDLAMNVEPSILSVERPVDLAMNVEPSILSVERPVDLAMNVEPSIFSVEQPSVFF